MPVPHGKTLPHSATNPSIRLITDTPSCPVLLKCDRAALLSIEVNGIPKPSVRWFVGQRLVRDGPKYGLTTDGRQIHALMIRRVTEELDQGVLVTASSTNGVSSRTIDVKTYRVYSRMTSATSPDVFETEAEARNNIGTLRSRRQVRSSQPIRYPDKGRQPLRSRSVTGFHSTPSAKGTTNKKVFSSTDDVFTERKLHYEDNSTSRANRESWKYGGARVRPEAERMEVSRKKKAFSWVENLVQELPSPTIKPGVWESERSGFLSQGTLLPSQKPAGMRSLPVGYSLSKLDAVRDRRLKEVEDYENEVLWEMYGFKLTSVYHSTGSGKEKQRRKANAEKLTCGTLPPRDPPSKHDDIGQTADACRKSTTNVTSKEPLYAMSLKQTQPKSRSASGLEILAQGLNAHSSLANRRGHPNYLYLKTNVRTVRCENPLLKETMTNQSGNRYSLPLTLDLPSLLQTDEQKEHDLDTGKLSESESRHNKVWKSSDDINSRKLACLEFDASADACQKLRGTDQQQLHHGSMSPDNASAIPRNPHEGCQLYPTLYEMPKRYSSPTAAEVSVTPNPSTLEQEKRKEVPSDPRRKAYSATVNLRRKDAAAGATERNTKFIVVDIDFDRGVDAEAKAKRNTTVPGTDWSYERGRSREPSQDSRRLGSLQRSRSADSSVAYLFQRMYSKEHATGENRNFTEAI